MDFGEFEGRNYAQLNGDPRYQAWIDSGGTLAFPGGESREAFIARCVDGMELVMEQIRQQLAYRACPKCRDGRQRYDTGAASGGGCGSRGYDHGAAFALLWR